MPYDVSIISHASLDITSDCIYLGGPASYCGKMLRNLKSNFFALVMVEKSFPFKNYYNENIKNYEFVYNRFTTTFLMKKISGKRHLNILRRAQNFSIEVIPKKILNSKYILLSPIVDDMPIKFVSALSNKTRAVICTDPFNNDNSRMNNKHLKYFNELMKYSQIIKMSENEIFGLFMTNNLNEAIEHLSRYRNTFLITLGSKGTLVYQKGIINEIIPSLKVYKPIDTTGCGDIFFSAFLYGLANSLTLKQSAILGNVCAGLSVISKGVDSVPSREEAFRHYSKIVHSKINTNTVLKFTNLI